jgi:hypothetical protein
MSLAPLKISAKNLGVTALQDFCPRCFWIKLKSGNKLPYQSFPGIFSSIDSYTKKSIHHIIDSVNPKPRWMQKIGNVVGYEPVPHFSKSKFFDKKSGITLTGIPDDIWILDDGSKIIPDFKTAIYSESQDKLLPMYFIQNNVYSVLIDKSAKLYLIYMEPDTKQETACNQITNTGFKMCFDATVVSVENDLKKVRDALVVTREITEMQKPPKGRIGCKDCSSLDSLIGLLK